MVEPELKEGYPNLVALLKDWNIEAGKDVVVDVSGMGQLFGFSELAPLAIEYPGTRSRRTSACRRSTAVPAAWRRARRRSTA